MTQLIFCVQMTPPLLQSRRTGLAYGLSKLLTCGFRFIETCLAPEYTVEDFDEEATVGELDAVVLILPEEAKPTPPVAKKRRLSKDATTARRAIALSLA